MALLANTVLVTNPAIVWREVAGEVVLLSPKAERLMGLNGCGGAVWKALDGKADLAAIAQDIAQSFGVCSEQVLADVLAFAGVLLERNLASAVDDEAC